MKVTNCKFLKYLNINAIVLYPFVLYQEAKPAQSIISHEEVHLRQIRENGVIKFYFRYCLEYSKGRMNGMTHYQAYRNISYEKEAYDSVV